MTKRTYIRAKPENNGPVTINGKVAVLVDDGGRPVYAHEMKVGDIYTILDFDTGEIKHERDDDFSTNIEKER